MSLELRQRPSLPDAGNGSSPGASNHQMVLRKFDEACRRNLSIPHNVMSKVTNERGIVRRRGKLKIRFDRQTIQMSIDRFRLIPVLFIWLSGPL